MSFNFKRFLITSSWVLIWATSCLGQAELQLGSVYPIPTGDNFLEQAYESNFGVSVEFSIPISKNWYGQISYSWFHARVTNPELIGVITRTGVTHIHGAVGYQTITKPKFEMNTKLGVGPALYRHFQDDDRFYDDGISLLIGIDLLYRIDSNFGISFGLDYLRDFLSTELNADDLDFFKVASIINPNLALSIKF